MMETTGVSDTAGMAATKVLEKGEHIKAGLIDFTAGSLGEFVQFIIESHRDIFNSEIWMITLRIFHMELIQFT